MHGFCDQDSDPVRLMHLDMLFVEDAGHKAVQGRLALFEGWQRRWITSWPVTAGDRHDHRRANFGLPNSQAIAHQRAPDHGLPREHSQIAVLRHSPYGVVL